jgi:predicted dehydrogenase
VARENKVCTQMGNQGTASNGLRTSVEIIQSGALGTIKEVHVWTNRPIWPQSPGVTKRLPGEKVPEYVHWDLFLGPAPERPYNPGYAPFKWRGWWDFGTGALGDMACHTMNLPFMALRLGFPTSVLAESEKLNSETYPGWAKVTYEFPQREVPGSADPMPPVRLTWYEGRRDGKLVLPPAELLQGYNGGAFSGSGSLIVGEKGTLLSMDDYGGSRVLLPVDKFKGFKMPKPTLPRRRDEKHGGDDETMKFEWVQAIRNKDPKLAMSNFDYAGMLTEAVLLGNVAIRSGGKKLMWDGPALRFTNSEEATALLKTDYRTGWKL